MSRPVKFRAWLPNGKFGDEKNGVMWFFPDSDITYDGSLVFWNMPEETHYIDESPMDRGSWIIMQFTGLLDKNGKEIYEGDVLRGGFKNITVEWKDDILGLEDHNSVGFDLDKYVAEDMEIVGNIYENPELA